MAFIGKILNQCISGLMNLLFATMVEYILFEIAHQRDISSIPIKAPYFAMVEISWLMVCVGMVGRNKSHVE